MTGLPGRRRGGVGDGREVLDPVGLGKPVLEVLDELCARHRPPAVLLERDDRYPPDDELATELAALRRA